MILIGQYDSSFVRRAGIAMTLYEIAFEHRPWSVFGDAEKIRPYNPLVRVPTLPACRASPAGSATVVGSTGFVVVVVVGAAVVVVGAAVVDVVVSIGAAVVDEPSPELTSREPEPEQPLIATAASRAPAARVRRNLDIGEVWQSVHPSP